MSTRARPCYNAAVFGASWGEIGFVALLVAIVLLAPIAPRVGGAIGGLFEKRAR